MKIDDIVKTKFDSPQVKAMVNVRITSNYISAHQNQFMKKFDLSMAQFNILRILRGAKEPLTVNTIKDRMIEKSPNTTRLMDKLMEKKLIIRKGCKEDKRQSFVEITDLGLNILTEIDNSDFAKNTETKDFTNEDAEQLSSLLDRLRSSF